MSLQGLVSGYKYFCSDDRMENVTTNEGPVMKKVQAETEINDYSGSNMSDLQKDHASAIEPVVPDLTTLKLKMLNCMSGEEFWMIYFILLIPRLNDDDFRLLSTQE
ncbi:hypothetical protein Tco_1426027, partial [Tanacetum coccineum]